MTRHSHIAPLKHWLDWSIKARWNERTDVGIAKDKSSTQFILHPVHLTSDDAEQGFTVDQDLDSFLLHRLIKGSRLIDVFEMVGEPAAATIFHADPDELRIRLGQELSELSKRRWREAHGGLSWTKFASRFGARQWWRRGIMRDRG